MSKLKDYIELIKIFDDKLEFEETLGYLKNNIMPKQMLENFLKVNPEKYISILETMINKLNNIVVELSEENKNLKEEIKNLKEENKMLSDQIRLILGDLRKK